MDLFRFAYVENFESQIETLMILARNERWDYQNDPQKVKHQILVNYITHTFRRIHELSKKNPASNFLYCDSTQACFNTGLFTSNFEEIYALFERNDPKFATKWRLVGFFKNSAHELKRISPLPKRAQYFDCIADLIYDTQVELRVNIDHILDDSRNRERIPAQYRSAPNLPMLFRGAALDYARIRVKENYKAAVPQIYKGKVQFLLPISLGDPKTVDLSLAVARDGDVYTGRTCLTLDMAYNNARLIAKPETDWLVG